MQLSPAGSKTEDMVGGMIRHVTVIGTMSHTTCAPLPTNIEAIALVPVPPVAMIGIDVLTVAHLVVAIVLHTESMVVMAAEGEAVEEVERTVTVNAHRLHTVGVIVLIKIRPFPHLVRSTSNMTAHFYLIISRVSRRKPPKLHTRSVLMS